MSIIQVEMVVQFRDEAFQYYFYFMQERMARFWFRYGKKSFYTPDAILDTYKFTNVYRSCDRVSQYLIRHVIYRDDLSARPEDICLRILVFKIFNRIETWEFISERYGEICCDTFSADDLSQLLSKRQKAVPIFSNAYMMTGSHHKYAYLSSKHAKWLQMLEDEMIMEGGFQDVLETDSLEDVYRRLRKRSFLGDFLAYQYAIDLDYSTVINFSENDFVKAGIGAVRGIDKCVSDKGGYNYEDIIRYVHENLSELSKIYAYDEFKPLPGRMPTLIDLQNCFCETDKYLRMCLPELSTKPMRIKQKFKAKETLPALFFPPKWSISF